MTYTVVVKGTPPLYLGRKVAEAHAAALQAARVAAQAAGRNV